MTIVSYAQNFEDVMLWRALKNIENGFYIDVGANDPVIDSVTKLFYEQGWRGINVEPLNTHYQDLIKDRPEDVNLRVAVGNTNGEIELWETDVRGWATASEEVIKKHEEEGHTGSKQTVSMLTLAQICEQYAKRDIHFLKIDVEGLEKSVLEGMDFFKYRPWVVVIEATLPNSTVEAYTEWEPILTAADFLNVYNDGLNRFYIPKERIALKPAFRYPPNAFDDYIKYGQLRAGFSAQQAEGRAQQAEGRAQQAEGRAQQAEGRAQQAEGRAQQAEGRAQQAGNREQQAESRAIAAENYIQVLVESTSWRITAPLRYLGDLVRLFKPSKIRSNAKIFLQRVAFYINRRPRLKRVALYILNRFPSLKLRMTRVTNSAFDMTSASTQHLPTRLSQLTPRARQIYHHLNTVIEQKKKGSH